MSNLPDTDEIRPEVLELLQRSNRLGSDPTYTNYAGGNTSTKLIAKDPASGVDLEVIYVKGSGGDLGTLSKKGLAALSVDRIRGLVKVYRGVEFEDEMVEAFDFCRFGSGGATPSIDTAMHGLIECDNVDHLHPDSAIALATALDGEALTKEYFGDEVLWVPWRRPGFQLGLDIAKIYNENPNAKGVILGGHGMTAWGASSKECEENSLFIINRAKEYIQANSKAEPFGAIISSKVALSQGERHKKAAALFAKIRGLASIDGRTIGHFNDTHVVLDFIAREKAQDLASLGSSCPDHFLRTKIRPLLLDNDANDPIEVIIQKLLAEHHNYRQTYIDYYKRYATSQTPPMRGADPAIFLIPGIGMFSFGKDAQTARVAGEFYINAINVMAGAEGISTYSPISEREKFEIEYWQLEEDKLRRMPKPKALSGKIALITGGGSGIGAAIARRLAFEGANVVIADKNYAGAEQLAIELGQGDHAFALGVDLVDESDIQAAFGKAVLAFGGIDILVNNAGLSISKSLLETTTKDWDIQHDVMAKGSFLASKFATRIFIDQGLGGDIVYIVSKNAFFAGPNNVAYGSAKADQAHQVRLLAAELGEYGVRVNGVNPDGVVQGSGIFSSGWGKERAAIYKVEEKDLGAFYASRTILKREVVPDDVAAAVFILVGGELSHTTGLHIPVDSGVAGAFLR